MSKLVLWLCLFTCCCACSFSWCFQCFVGCNSLFSDRREFKSQGWAGLIQGFAGLSGLLLNLGAFTGHKDDLHELEIYKDDIRDLNSMFLFFMILQIVFCILDLALICGNNVYVHLIVMWVEDVLLEIPLLAIAFYLQTYTEGTLTLILVIVGGILGLVVAVGETSMEVID